MRTLILAAALALPAFCAGCAVYANAPDISRYTELRPGVSTLADAERLMGKPAAAGQVPGVAITALWADDGRVIDLSFDAAGCYRGVISEAGF